jgi:hypothetical protein
MYEARPVLSLVRGIGFLTRLFRVSSNTPDAMPGRFHSPSENLALYRVLCTPLNTALITVLHAFSGDSRYLPSFYTS